MDKQETQKEITLQDLAESIENLAVITANGFVELKNELKQEIAGVRTELKKEISEVKTELKQEIAGVRTELKEEIASVKSELYNTRVELKSEIRELRDEIAEINRKLTEIHKDIDNLYKLSHSYKREMEEENKILKLAILEIAKQTNVKLDKAILAILEKK